GLPNDVVESITPDQSGNLWLSTHKGICRLAADSSLMNYDIHDGLLSNEFLSRSSFATAGQQLFFGNTRGLNAFFPDSVHMNGYVPPVMITNFRIFDHSVFKKDTLFRKKIFNNEVIQLPFRQNNFTFEFAALNYINPEKNQYAYKLEGYDKDWIHSESRRYAAYTNLDPGEYIFHVKAANNDGIWNEKGI